MQLPAGDYHLASISIPNLEGTDDRLIFSTFDYDKFRFVIEQDTINYMGHISFNGNALKLTYKENINEIIQNLVPTLIQKYKLVYTHESAYERGE